MELRDPIDRAVGDVLASGRYVLGDVVERLERRIAERLELPRAVSVANGSDALALVFEALGIGPGDEVILPPYTFIATAGAVVRVGATPVFADIAPDGFHLDPAAAAAAITSRTAAIVPVHLFGQLADIAPFRSLARRHGLALIEDAAQALGATRLDATGEVRPGHGGVAATFSFYPTKNLAAAGDGGLIATSDEALAERLLGLRNHGRSGDRVVGAPGHNSRLDALQAAILEVKLDHLDAWNARRRANAEAYDTAFEQLEGVRLPNRRAVARHTFHQYALRCRDREMRDALGAGLDAAGVGHAVYYDPPLHRRAVFTSAADCPQADEASGSVLCLPVYAHLTEPERAHVIETVRRFLGKARWVDRPS